MTRDNRIGEITNIATTIENKYTENEKYQKKYSDQASLLRVYQGKEIDFLKTGFRWQIPARLKSENKKIPWFLLYNYLSKLKKYEKIKQRNKLVKDESEKTELNAFRSPSPMNELCDYICTWERKKLKWDNTYVDTRCLIINNSLDLNDRYIIRSIRHLINDYAAAVKKLLDKQKQLPKSDDCYSELEILLEFYKDKLFEIVSNEELLANYVIKVSYSNALINKSLAWSGFGEWIIKNLEENSNPKKNIRIIEVPYMTNASYEYLGKYYELMGV